MNAGTPLQQRVRVREVRAQVEGLTLQQLKRVAFYALMEAQRQPWTLLADIVDAIVNGTLSMPNEPKKS